ncbi:MAG: hypothetical protein ACYC69_18075 [Thermodesulfovibrionales bacterium]
MIETILRLSILLMVSMVVSCIDTTRDVTPPFTAGFGPSGVLYEGPIGAGGRFGLTVVFETDSYLDDIKVEIVLPPEVEVEKIPPERRNKYSLDDLTLRENLMWTGSMKTRTEKKWLDILVKSKTDWTKWSRPIEVYIGVNARGADKNAPWPDGHYSKTITWSHKGYKDSDWTGPDNKSYR